jgi:hypothetical protein
MCQQPGSLTEYTQYGTIKRSFPNCLPDYRSIAVHASGNAFAAGLTGHGSHVGLVEFPAGTTNCRHLQNSEQLHNNLPSLQVTPKGNLVVDLGGIPPVEIETLARPFFHVLLHTTELEDPDPYYSTFIALTNGGTQIWNAGVYTNYYTDFGLYPYPAGGQPILHYNVGHLGPLIGIAALH